MGKSVYQVWLDDDKMRRGRKDIDKEKEARKQFLDKIRLSLMMVSLVFIALMFVNTSYATFLPLIGMLLIITIEEKETILSRFPSLNQSHIRWQKQHKEKEFSNYFVKEAIRAGISNETAIKAMTDFIVNGDISYAAFDSYCRNNQEQQTEEEKKQNRYEKTFGKLAEKFMPSLNNENNN